MRRTIVTLLLLAALVGPAAGPAAAGDGFTFFGSGFGHGLGMSQWGAYGLALEDWPHQDILTHFYRDTQVRQAEGPPDQLRVGLAHGERRIRLTAEDAGVDLRLGATGGDPVATVPAGETWTVRIREGSYLILDAARDPVGEPVGGASTDLFATYAEDGARVQIPQAGHTYARGWIEFNIYDCGAECRLRLVLTIAPQEYLYGLAEVPSSWPVQALQAQAVAARTYAFAKAAYGQHRPVCNCALFASAADQVYAGWDKEAGTDGGRWVEAVDATDGQVIVHGGEMITAFYSSSSGGHTENNENVWGGTPIPYLRGVCDPGDFTAANPSRVWDVSYTAQEVTDRLRPYTGNVGTVTSFAAAVRGVSGRIITIVVKGNSGDATISGGELRVGLGLRDDRVWVNVDKNVVGPIREKYDNLDCAPGLPTSAQSAVPGGASQRFVEGAIYRNEGSDVTVWLRGSIYAKYRELGEARSVLGLPRSGAVRLARPEGCRPGACSRTVFDGGRIYFKDGLGAYELHGPVLAFYLSHGAANGSLGFPTSDVRRRAGGRSAADFEDGTVVCTADGACRRT